MRIRFFSLRLSNKPLTFFYLFHSFILKKTLKCSLNLFLLSTLIIKIYNQQKHIQILTLIFQLILIGLFFESQGKLITLPELLLFCFSLDPFVYFNRFMPESTNTFLDTTLQLLESLQYTCFQLKKIVLVVKTSQNFCLAMSSHNGMKLSCTAQV